jgi:hypothetical protein
MRRFAILLVAFVGVAIVVQTACTTKGQNSAVVTTKIVQGKSSGSADAGPGAGTLCAFAPGDTEIDNVPLGPGSFGLIGVVVDNRLLNASSVNPLLRTNSNDFQPHQAVVSYEVLGGGSVNSATTIPAAGMAIPGGGTGVVPLTLFPSGFAAASAGIAGGTYIRVTLRIEGKLTDGSTVKSSDREYIFLSCPACAAAACQ